MKLKSPAEYLPDLSGLPNPKELAAELPDIRKYLPEMTFNKPDLSRDLFMLKGALARRGFDCWRHFFFAEDPNGKRSAFLLEFIAYNPALAVDIPVFSHDKNGRETGGAPSYLVVSVTRFGEKNSPSQADTIRGYYAKKDITIKNEIPFLLSADVCFLSETRTFGRVQLTEEDAAAHPEYQSCAGDVLWDLKLDKTLTFNCGYQSSIPSRAVELNDLYWHAQGLKTAFRGTLSFCGTKYQVVPEECCGYSDKIWGADFPDPWLFLTCSNFISKKTGRELSDTAFVLAGADPKVGPVNMDFHLVSAVWYEGMPMEFNFAKVWHLTKTGYRTHFHPHHIQLQFVQETPLHKVQGDLSVPIDTMTPLSYEAPGGGLSPEHLCGGCDVSGTLKLYCKKISLTNHWRWEKIDELASDDFFIEYGWNGKRPPEHP